MKPLEMQGLFRSQGVGAYVNNAILRRLEIIIALLAVVALLLVAVTVKQ